jgi:uncharacterized protein
MSHADADLNGRLERSISALDPPAARRTAEGCRSASASRGQPEPATGERARWSTIGVHGEDGGRRMSRLYDEVHRVHQRRFDTERLADRIEERLVRDRISDEDREFIEKLDMFFLATADAQGRPNCSYKGGDPGFVRVLDDRTIAFPCYDGNGMFLSVGNVDANPHVGLLFIDFVSPRRLRLNGTARVEPPTFVDPPHHAAQLVIAVTVREVFPNCPRYIHRMELVERSTFVPRPDAETPVPGWKQKEWARDVLPTGDPATRPPAK